MALSQAIVGQILAILRITVQNRFFLTEIATHPWMIFHLT